MLNSLGPIDLHFSTIGKAVAQVQVDEGEWENQAACFCANRQGLARTGWHTGEF